MGIYRSSSLSVARLTLAVVLAAVVVLAVTTCLIGLIKPAPIVGLLIVFGGLILAVVAMWWSANTVINRSIKRDEATRAAKVAPDCKARPNPK